MSSMLTLEEWQTQKRDDSPFIDEALREWNLAQPAWTPFKPFRDLPPAQQSRVAMRAAELSKEGRQ